MKATIVVSLTEGKTTMFNFMPTANINRETGIHYGAISGHSLDPDGVECYTVPENWLASYYD